MSQNLTAAIASRCRGQWFKGKTADDVLEQARVSLNLDTLPAQDQPSPYVATAAELGRILDSIGCRPRFLREGAFDLKLPS